MLKNASSLAIVGLDTAENGPSKVRQVTNRIDAIIASNAPQTGPEVRGAVLFPAAVPARSALVDPQREETAIPRP